MGREKLLTFTPVELDSVADWLKLKFNKICFVYIVILRSVH